MLYLPQWPVRLVSIRCPHRALYQHHEAIHVHFVKRERLLKPRIPSHFHQLLILDRITTIRILVEIFQILRLSLLLFLFKFRILVLYQVHFRLWNPLAIVVILKLFVLPPLAHL